MGTQNSQIIAAYVARVDELQKQRQDALTATELKAIARELGVSEPELAHAERTAQDHLTRGQGYIAHGLLDDALRELRAAVVLQPLEAGTVLVLAEACAARWRATGDVSSRDEADQLARQALALDPGLQAAYALRRSLTMSHATQTGPQASLGRAILAAVVLLLVGLMGALLLLGGGAAPPAEIASPPEATAGVTAATEAGDPTVRSVPLAALPALQLQPHRISLSEYDDSWAFEANGVLQNTSDKVLRSVGAKVELRDASGRVVAAQTFEVLEDYQARQRPGDVVGYDLLIYEDHYAADYARPVEAVFTLIAAETEAAAASYPTAAPVAVGWAQPAPPGLQVEAALRQRTVNENSVLGKVHFRGEYEVRLPPGSASAELLKLQLEFLRADGTVLATDTTYVVSTQEPPLAAGEARVAQFLTFLEAPPASERLTVIEAR